MIEEMFSLQGKTALVTGASSGLGQHYAKLMAAAGAKVVLAARREDRLQAAVSDIQSAGGQAFSVAMDVADYASVVAAFEKIDEQTDRLDILINNAGILGDSAKLAKDTVENWNSVLNTNLMGSAWVAQQAAKIMIAQESGSIINISSIYGLRNGINAMPYCVSKSAVIALTNNLAAELWRHGIRVNTLSPGFFKTALNEDMVNSEGGKAFIKSLVPRRLGEYKELDGAILLLASDAGSFINGAEITVDGGAIQKPL